MLIEKNTLCYASERGHNNFWYPSATRLVIKKNCQAERVSWLGGGNKMPIKLLKSCLLPINITENTTTNISPPTKNDYVIVWIEKNV